MSQWLNVGPASEFESNACRLVDLEDIRIAVFQSDGEYFAIEDRCSHEEFPLSEGEIEGERIDCAKHGATFSLRNGEALSAPAYEPVAVFPVRIEHGMV